MSNNSRTEHVLNMPLAAPSLPLPLKPVSQLVAWRRSSDIIPSSSLVSGLQDKAAFPFPPTLVSRGLAFWAASSWIWVWPWPHPFTSASSREHTPFKGEGGWRAQSWLTAGWEGGFRAQDPVISTESRNIDFYVKPPPPLFLVTNFKIF